MDTRQHLKINILTQCTSTDSQELVKCFFQENSEQMELLPSAPYAGSVKIALDLRESFDKYIFIEKDGSKIEKLKKIREEEIKTNSDLKDRITIENGDCNEILKKVIDVTDWNQWRAVCFLDPFGLSVKHETLELIAQTKKIDLWYLLNDLARFFPREVGIRPVLPDTIKKVFGPDFPFIYKRENESTLFGEEEKSRRENREKLMESAIDHLEKIFKGIVRHKSFENSRNTKIFHLFFLMNSDNARAINLAKNLSKNIFE